MKSTVGLIALFLVFNLHSVFSQSLQLKGVVVDAHSKESIPFVTITAYHLTSIVDGISTSDSGSFNLKTNKKVSHLEISFIGYQTQQLDIDQISDKKNMRIELVEASTQLDEVQITAKRTTTRIKIDRKIIDFGLDIQQSGVNALEAFDQIGEIETNLANGTISLRGNDNVRVLINGKPSSLSATELLKQISASNIKQVEIITSPSVKYKAEGLSGIINIKLKRNNGQGFNMMLNNTVGTKRHGFGLQSNYNTSNFNFRLNTSFDNSATRDDQFIDREFTSGKTERIFTPNLFDGKVYKIAAGLDFFINDKHEFTIEIDYTDDSHTYFNESSYTNSLEKPDYLFLRKTKHAHYNTIFQVNYRLNLNSENTHFLEVDYNVNQSENNYPQADYEDGVVLINKLLKEDYNLHSAAVDYTFPLEDKGSIETGISVNTQALQSSQIFFTVTNTDVFSYNEQLFGMYGLVNYSFEKIHLKGGLRYEYFTSNSNNSSIDFDSKQSYKNLFPSVHMSYVLNEKSTLNFGYSQRISRPNFHHVNALQLYSPFFRWDYNPNIIPESSNNFDLSYHKNANNYSVSLTAFYRQRKDVILWIASTENNQQVFTYENSGMFNSYGLESNFSVQLASFWDTNVSANYYQSLVDLKNIVTWDRTYSSTYQLKNKFKINSKIQIDLTYVHRPKAQRTFSYLEKRNRVDVALRGTFFKGKLTTGLRFVDVFSGNAYKSITKTNALTQKTVWESQSQRFNFLLSLKYQVFKNKKKLRNKKQRSYNEVPID